LRKHVLGNKSDISGLPLTENMIYFVDNLPGEISQVLDKISTSGGGVWIVGGAVRDAAMGLIPADIDLATDLMPERLIEIFPDAIKTGVAFGTVTLKSGTYLLQTTTLRVDGEYHDGRRPDSVEWNLSLHQDLKRRDFTINSMAIDVARRRYYDPNGGMEDIAQKVIRCVGNSRLRINEDALRILRAYRFLSQISSANWRLDISLSRVIEDCSYLINELSKERVWQELSKILGSKKANKTLQIMHNDGVLSVIFGWENRHNEKLFLALEDATELDATALFVLLNYHLNEIDLERICKQLKLSNNDRRKIVHFNTLARTIPKHEVEDLRLHRHLAGSDWEQIAMLRYIFCQHNIDKKFSHTDSSNVNAILESLRKLPPLAFNKPIFDGNWLMTVTNISQGEKLGRLIEWLFRIQIENDLQTLPEIESYLVKIQWQNSDFSQWPRLI